MLDFDWSSLGNRIDVIIVMNKALGQARLVRDEYIGCMSILARAG